MLEHHVRRRIRAWPNVTVRDRCDVVGLTADGNRITGVRVRQRGDASVEELLEADLVVDATGRGSRAPVWLSGLGFSVPTEDQLRVDLGYTTRRYRLASDALDGDLGLLRAPTPAQPRGAALARLEHGVWMLTLIGLCGDHPPVPVDDFDRFALSVGSEELSSMIRAAEPIDAPVAFRFPASTRRYYERIDLPRNLVMLGDSVCSLNPVYGQGMTVAALEALALARQLSGEHVPPSRAMMSELAKIVDVPWQLASAVDRAFLPSDQPVALRDRLAAAYVDRVQATAEHDSAAGRAFLRVSGLIDPPSALMRPRLMWRTLIRLFGLRAHAWCRRPQGSPATSAGGTDRVRIHPWRRAGGRPPPTAAGPNGSLARRSPPLASSVPTSGQDPLVAWSQRLRPRRLAMTEIRVVAMAGSAPCRRSSPSAGSRVSKTVVSVAVGIAEAEGLRAVTDPVLSHLNQLAPVAAAGRS